MAYNVLLFFENGSQGWSESYWMIPSAPSILTSIITPGTKTAITNLAKKRSMMLGAGSTLTYVRVSDPAVKRDVIFPNLTALPIAGGLGRCDQANAGILVGCWSAVPTVWSRRIFRGVPDTAIDTTQPKGMNKADPFFGPAEAFLKYLEGAASPWRIRHLLATYEAYSEHAFIRATTKRTGRPFGLPRGRRPKRRAPVP